MSTVTYIQLPLISTTDVSQVQIPASVIQAKETGVKYNFSLSALKCSIMKFTWEDDYAIMIIDSVLILL
jgi:hypothetical protein